MPGYACSNGKIDEKIVLTCEYGIIYMLISVGYGSEKSTCLHDVPRINKH